MKRDDGKKLLKSIIISEKFKTINELIASASNDMSMIITTLIYANGFPYVDVKREENKLIFLAGHDSNNLINVVSYNLNEKTVNGNYKNVIEKTYLTINAIENILDSSVYLPFEIRQQRIKNTIESIDVDYIFYSNILRNW